ncbi:hypothetical protein G9272_41020 [Streptomyces asoensis]|uniref:Uncharacterized protein n=1 Tax=Streptomyces asoensis TaxID=249586 RepID=A0A6M4X2R8_9ACTN|nr:hypothetical protein [Streptomyces asoensis]QJT05925.1 hypothetical protein G9272_41020 [Streptomyces asoensis]
MFIRLAYEGLDARAGLVSSFAEDAPTGAASHFFGFLVERFVAAGLVLGAQSRGRFGDMPVCLV